MTRAGLVVWALAVLGLACAERERNPYAVALDLHPSIAALGGDDDAADAAADLLSSLGPAAAPALTAALVREAVPVRVRAVELLAALAEPPVDTLLGATRDGDDAVRAAALATIGGIDDPRVAPAVEAALDSPSAEERLAAAGACARACRSRDALEKLVRLALDADDFVLAERARGALRDRGAAGGLDAREAILRVAPTTLAAATSSAETLRAGLLLADVGDARAVAPLVAAALDPARLMVMRVHAIAALGQVAEPGSVAGLVPLVSAGPLVITHAACGALARLDEDETAGAADALARCPGRDRNRRPRP